MGEIVAMWEDSQSRQVALLRLMFGEADDG